MGSLIRRERQKQGISLRELARRAGISGSMLSQVENDRTRPSVSTIYALATELGVSIDALLSEQPDPGPWRTVLGILADFLTVRREYAPLIDLALGERSQRFRVGRIVRSARPKGVLVEL